MFPKFIAETVYQENDRFGLLCVPEHSSEEDEDDIDDGEVECGDRRRKRPKCIHGNHDQHGAKSVNRDDRAV